MGGALSGTSGDGIDVVISEMEIAGGERLVGCRSLAFETLPFPPSVARRVREVLDGVQLEYAELAHFSRDLGVAFGEAARSVAEAGGASLDLLGSHGLTIFHHDGAPSGSRASLQVGDGDHVAESAGCCVVSDFRQRDLAAGGEGAPISILADDVVFAQVARPAAILNLGGMANLSWLGNESEPLAFDTGPAGSLLDGFARALLHRPFDRGGEAALRGRILEPLLARWLEHPFFGASPPKSTGRDTFGAEWVRHLLAAASGASSAEDLLTTATEFVARTVALGLDFLPAPPECLWLAGGGVHNSALVAALERSTGVPVLSSAEVGVDPDAREALVFAVLAARCVLGEAVTRPSATGARSGRVLGKISPSVL